VALDELTDVACTSRPAGGEVDGPFAVGAAPDLGRLRPGALQDCFNHRAPPQAVRELG